MCFFKSEKSRVLIAKKNIKVYKIGTYANDTSFNPFFYREFEYPVNEIKFEKVEFTNVIYKGFHSYIMCELVCYNTNVNVYSCKNPIYCSLLPYKGSKIYLGEFIIPKGTTYCINNNGEVVSDRLMYTGNHIEINSDKIYNSKDLWKEK